MPPACGCLCRKRDARTTFFQNLLPEFRRCATGEDAFCSVHENFHLSHRSSCHRSCRGSAVCGQHGRSGSRAPYGKSAQNLSVPSLSPLGRTWRANHRSLCIRISAIATARLMHIRAIFAAAACFALTMKGPTSSMRKSWMAENRNS